MRKKGYETEKEEEPAQGELMVRLLPGEQLGLNAIGGGASEDQCGAHLTWSYWMMRRQGTYSPAPFLVAGFLCENNYDIWLRIFMLHLEVFLTLQVHL